MKPYIILTPVPQSPAKRVVKTQDLPDSSTKRTPSKKTVLWGAWRGRNAKPSTPVVTFPGKFTKFD